MGSDQGNSDSAACFLQIYISGITRREQVHAHETRRFISFERITGIESEGVSMVTIADAGKVARFLEAELSPVAILLFGSVARSGEGDDLDILIVTDQEDMHETVGVCLHGYGKHFPIDYFVASTRLLNEQFRKGSPFLNLIQDEGKILYMKSTSNEWIDLSQEDLRQANYLMAGHFYRGAC